mgnify:CR=1
MFCVGGSTILVVAKIFKTYGSKKEEGRKEVYCKEDDQAQGCEEDS